MSGRPRVTGCGPGRGRGWDMIGFPTWSPDDPARHYGFRFSANQQHQHPSEPTNQRPAGLRSAESVRYDSRHLDGVLDGSQAARLAAVDRGGRSKVDSHPAGSPGSAWQLGHRPGGASGAPCTRARAAPRPAVVALRPRGAGRCWAALGKSGRIGSCSVWGPPGPTTRRARQRPALYGPDWSARADAKRIAVHSSA